MATARNLATVGSATLASRLLGFVRDAGVAALLGAGPLADAYIAALQIPNLFRRLLADGALNSALVPMWLRICSENGRDGARAFGAQAAAAIFVALGALALICILFAPLVIALVAPGFQSNGDRYDVAITLLRLAVPYIALAGLVAVGAAILNAEGRVGAAAAGVVAFNCVLVAAVAIVALLSDGSTRSTANVLALSFVLAGAAQLALVAAAMIRLKLFPDRLTTAYTPEVRRLYARALPGAVASGMPQLVLIAGTIIASPSPSAVSWLYYANRLYELPLGIVSIAIAAVLAPRISATTLAKDGEAAAQSHALEIALAVALPAAAGLALLATPITSVLFERGAFGTDDTAAVAKALAVIAAGLAGHALEKIFGAISFANEDARTPMLTGLAGLATTLVVAALLFPRYGHIGVAAAIALSGWVGALLLLIVLQRRAWIVVPRATWMRLLRIVAATLVMVCAVTLTMVAAAAYVGIPASFLARLAWLAVVICVGISTYVVSLQRLGIADVRELVAAIRTKT